MMKPVADVDATQMSALQMDSLEKIFPNKRAYIGLCVTTLFFFLLTGQSLYQITSGAS